jgi:FixJ family two-component response regulator
MLTAMGFAVETFTSAEEAIDSSCAAPDLAVIDVVLRGPIDGFALGAALKQGAPDLRVLYCSGSSFDVLMANGHIVDDTAICGRFINKPFTTDTFMTKVKEVLHDCAGIEPGNQSPPVEPAPR